MGAVLSSVPLCSRTAGDSLDNNNNHSEPDNNLVSQEVVETQPAPVQTSTPKLEREREPAEDSLDFGPGSDGTTFGSDSGLEHSGDELELSRYVTEDDLEDVARGGAAVHAVPARVPLHTDHLPLQLAQTDVGH